MNLLSVSDLHVNYALPGGTLQAVRGVSLDIAYGETVGVVGESGCGKSTLGKAILRLAPVSSGSIVIDGHDITTLSPRRLRPLRQLMQMVFQDPNSSLNPRHRIGRIIAQPLMVAGQKQPQIQARVQTLLGQVGLPPSAASRFAHEFSGGQRQRVGIARALALQPKLLICDEPVSALDVSVRAQVINLLLDLQSDLGISYLFISHDLSLVRHVCNRLIVMYLGRVVESGDTESIWQHPAHPYTKLLLASAPIAHPKARKPRPEALLDGELPNPMAPPSGCAFHARCPQASLRCQTDSPVLRTLPNGRELACHLEPFMATTEPHRNNTSHLKGIPVHVTANKPG